MSTVVTFMVGAAPRANWDAALNRYLRIRETWNVHLDALLEYERGMGIGRDDPEHDRLEEVSGDWCGRDAEALRDLIDVPSPTVAAALLKFELCIENGENAEPVLDDLRRLTGIANPALDTAETV
jgi:hypothetical protein